MVAEGVLVCAQVLRTEQEMGYLEQWAALPSVRAAGCGAFAVRQAHG